MARLDEQLTALSTSFTLPEEIRSTLQGANRDLERSGAAPGIAVGERAPDFTLPYASGNPVSLRDRLAAGPVVLSFYRGDWCPYCNIELRAQQSRLPEMRELGASLIAISPQAPDRAAALTEREGLGFDVLSDLDQTTIRAYRVHFTLPPAVKDVYTNLLKNDLTKQNADGSWDLPVPATFVLDRDATVRASHVSADYSTRMEPDDILDALRDLA